jgi:hypothetical protein
MDNAKISFDNITYNTNSVPQISKKKKILCMSRGSNTSAWSAMKTEELKQRQI